MGAEKSPTELINRSDFFFPSSLLVVSYERPVQHSTTQHSLLHPPLTEPDAIRLFHLQPGLLLAPLSCILTPTTLSVSSSNYIALSCVWGDYTDRRNITVNNTPVIVTKNLAAALRSIRDVEKAVTVWADALCINQTDDEEKSQQVRQMGLVYETARQTIICLGEDGVTEDLFTRPWFSRVWTRQELVSSMDP